MRAYRRRKNAGYGFGFGQPMVELQVFQISVDDFFLRHVFANLLVEITIGAFAFAERPMDINAKGKNALSGQLLG